MLPLSLYCLNLLLLPLDSSKLLLQFSYLLLLCPNQSSSFICHGPCTC
jgi:hypothetical protein